MSERDFKSTPLMELSTQSKELLSFSLNPSKLFTFNGINRDWSGLVQVLSFSKYDEMVVSSKLDKVEKILEIWQEKEPVEPTFCKLLEVLAKIGRFDVIDDLKDQLVSDAQRFLCRPTAPEMNEPEQDLMHHYPSTSTEAPQQMLSFFSENHILTVQDQIARFPQKYDAFVLYDSDESRAMLENIKTIVSKLEIDFRLCIKDRDFLSGIDMEHSAVLRLISERCYRVVLFVTRKFVSESRNLRIVQFCQNEAIERSIRKIVPIIMEEVVLPLELRNYCSYKYYRRSPFVTEQKFVENLTESLRLLRF